MLSALNADKVCFLITKIREFDVQVEENTGGGSDASDDKFVAVFNDDANTSVKSEIQGFITAMDVDERLELIALSMVGRGDYAPAEWAEAMEVARSRPEPSTAKFLLENPLASDDLEEGLSLFGLSCEAFDADRL
jgi:hypothetical protein